MATVAEILSDASMDRLKQRKLITANLIHQIHSASQPRQYLSRTNDMLDCLLCSVVGPWHNDPHEYECLPCKDTHETKYCPFL